MDTGVNQMNAYQGAKYYIMYSMLFVITACTPQASTHLPAVDSNQEGGKVTIKWLLMHNGEMALEIMPIEFSKELPLEHRGAWRVSKQSDSTLRYILQESGTYHAQNNLDGTYHVDLNPGTIDHNMILFFKSGSCEGYWQFLSDAGVEKEGELYIEWGS